MTFWIVTSAMALGVGITLALQVFRAQRSETPPSEYDLRVYRDQLKEIERDLARGVIGPEDAERIRAEVSRRILAADAAAQAATGGTGAARHGSRLIAALVALVLVGGSLWLYRTLGAPGYGDLALADRIEMAEAARQTRPGQSEAEASAPSTKPPENANVEFLALLDQLRKTVAERPDDLQGHVLLARNEAAIGNFAAAHKAQARVIALKGTEADAGDFSDLADMMILAARGYVSPEAEMVLEQVLRRDPANGAARYYMGLMLAQTGRPDLTFRIWRQLLREGPEDAPWIPPIEEQITDLAARAGVDYSPEPIGSGQRGPTAADIQAAGQMSAQERMEMIESMVAGLADRLGSEGGPPGEWARLIGALSVLGRGDEATEILTEARSVFADNPSALDMLAQAAERAGLE